MHLDHIYIRAAHNRCAALDVRYQRTSLTAVRALLSDSSQALIISPQHSQQLSISGNCRKVQIAITVAEHMLQRPLAASIRFEPLMDALNGTSAGGVAASRLSPARAGRWRRALSPPGRRPRLGDDLDQDIAAEPAEQLLEGPAQR